MLKKLTVYPALCLLLSACQMHVPVVIEKSTCDDKVEAVEQSNVDYLLIANKMIDSMIQDKNAQQATASKRMKLSILPVQNNTNEAIDMDTIHRTIKNRVLRSGRFIINDSITEQFQLSGSMEKITRSSAECADSYTQFSLQLMNTENNRILWSEDKNFN